jgi:hypothetical protein
MSMVTSAVAPILSAIFVAVILIFSCTSFCICSSRVRIVPAIVNSSGIMFSRMPPLILPIVITTGALVNSDWRETIICKPLMIWLETAIGSTPVHGVEPCVCFPLTLMVNQSDAAIKEPDLYSILPISSCASM